MIPGLIVYPSYLSRDTQERILREVDKSPWSLALSRQTQHYGGNYDYRTRQLSEVNVPFLHGTLVILTFRTKN